VASPAEKPVRLDERLALRPKEAAATLGISERALRARLSELPHVRIGNLVLLPVAALQRWLDERAQVEKARSDAIADEILRDIKSKG
jgi:excisionase family DNA binding protein